MDERTPIEIMQNTSHTWHQLLHRAKIQSLTSVTQEVEHYLALMLESCAHNKMPLNRNIAQHFLLAQQTEGRVGLRRLQSVGDQCLLITGLFPELIQRKNVNTRYIMDVGCIAYSSIARHPYAEAMACNTALFDQLGQQFQDLSRWLNMIPLPRP